MRTRNYFLLLGSLLLLFWCVIPAQAGFIEDMLKKELMKQLAKKLGQDAPTVSSANAVFPTVPELPGQPFQPKGRPQTVLTQLAKTTDGTITLRPGDYEFKVRCNCMKHSAHSPSGHLYLLAPIKGRRAAVITILNARAAAALIPAWQVQHMSWDLQAGLRYEQLPANEQTIADQYLSDFKRDLMGSQLDQIRDTYNKFGPKIGLGTFDSVLAGDALGDVGKKIIELENFQTQLASSNTAAGVDSLIPRAQSDATGGPENTPWSRISDRVYARMFTAGGYQSIGALQIRVALNAEATADAHNSGADTPDTGVNVPITSLEGEPQNDNIQPLSMVPQPPVDAELEIISPEKDTEFDATDDNDNTIRIALQAKITGSQAQTVQTVHWTFTLVKEDGTEITDPQLSPLDLSSSDCIDQPHILKWNALILDDADAIQNELEGQLKITADASVNGTPVSGTLTVKLSEFSVRDVPNIMRNIGIDANNSGWNKGAEFLDRWFSSPPLADTAAQASGPNWSLPTYHPNSLGADPSSGVSMAWVLDSHNTSDDRVKVAYKDIFDEDYLLTQNSINVLLAHLKRDYPSQFKPGATLAFPPKPFLQALTQGKFPNAFVSYGSNPAKALMLHDEHFQHSVVNFHPVSSALDPSFAAIGDFSFYAIPIGEATIHNEKRADIVISSIAVYAVANFHFVGLHPWWKLGLGSWKKPGSVSKGPLPGYTMVDDNDYLEYRAKHKFGGDFLEETNISIVALPNKFEWPKKLKADVNLSRVAVLEMPPVQSPSDRLPARRP